MAGQHRHSHRIALRVREGYRGQEVESGEAVVRAEAVNAVSAEIPRAGSSPSVVVVRREGVGGKQNRSGVIGGEVVEAKMIAAGAEVDAAEQVEGGAHADGRDIVRE